MGLLALLLSVPLLACATDDLSGGSVVYRYPPASLLQLDADPVKPTLEELQGPDGDKHGARYILDLELSGATRGQAIRCLQLWVASQRALDAGQDPAETPAYCVFENEQSSN